MAEPVRTYSSRAKRIRPHVNVQAASSPSADAQSRCSKRTCVPPSSAGVSVHMIDVGCHSGGPSTQRHNSEWGRSTEATSKRNLVSASGPKEKTATDPSTGSYSVWSVQKARLPAALLMASNTASGGAAMVSAWQMSGMATP